MSRRGRAVRRFAAVVLAAGLVGGAVAGIAGGAIKQKKASVELDVAESGSATARCGKGTRAVSGGFDDPTFSATAPPGSFAQTFTSRRSSKREWTSFVTNGALAPLDSTTALTFAYCSDELPKLKTVSETVSIPSGENASVTARCPRGGEAVSGGFVAEQVGTFDGVFPIESRRVGKRGWIASGDADADADLTSYAYCAKKKLGLKKRSVTTTPNTDAENLSAKARCKRRHTVVSGGFAGPGIPEAFVDPFESRRAGRRAWRASAAAYEGFGGSIDWDVYAYCLKKEKKKR